MYEKIFVFKFPQAKYKNVFEIGKGYREATLTTKLIFFENSVRSIDSGKSILKSLIIFNFC